MKPNVPFAGQSSCEGVRWTEEELWRMLGHDLRVPLNGIQGFLDLLFETRLEANQRELVVAAIENTESLRSILDGILENAHPASGRLFVSRQATDMRSVLTTILYKYKRQSDRCGLNLMAEVAEDVPRLVSLDKGKLLQILNYLIGNVIKFTRGGEISMQVTLECAKELVVEIRTADDQIPTSLHGSCHCGNRVPPLEGTGLAIVRKLIELSGGGIVIGNTQDHGSTVTIRLPIT